MSKLFPILFIPFLMFMSCHQQKEKSHLESTGSELQEQETHKIYGYNSDSIQVIKSKIQQNQNLSDLLLPYQVSYPTIHQIAKLSRSVHDVKNLMAHKEYEIICSKDSIPKAKCLIYHPNPIEYVVYKFDDSIAVSKEKFEVSTITKTASGKINSSLYNALINAGNSPKLSTKLSEIYAWQIDFFGIQKGDTYKIVFDELYANNKWVGVGAIKAAYFNHMGTDYYAFRYKQDSITEYFDEKGQRLRKAFLKAPLSYRRISSKFSYSRLHPILKRRMPHLGVDYAASLGTPVFAIGDGKVIKANYSGAAGNYVKIKHNGVYTTGYMHLWKFEKGIRLGAYVKQGQLIGYVGSTGRSTGPHLDFRMWKNGQAVDPLKVELPAAEPITEEHKMAFFKNMELFKKALSKIQISSI